MKPFFWCCLFLLIPGLLLRLDLGGSGILATDILLPIFAFVWIFRKMIIDRSFPKCHFILPGFVFFSIALLSFLLAAGDLSFKAQVLSGAYLVRFFSLLIFGWATVDLFRSIKDKQSLLNGLFWISGVTILLGYAQFVFIPDIGTWSTEGGWDPHTGRLLGTWMDPNFVAGFLGLIIPLAMGQWYDSESSKERFLLGGLILLFLGALFLTFSRSGYLAATMGLFLFFLFRDPKVILIGIVVVMIGIFSNERAQKRVMELAGTVTSIILQSSDEIDPTASLRIQSWMQSFELFQKRPILGIGFNTYRYIAAEEGIVDESNFSSGGSDSTLLTVLVTTGVVGCFAFLWFLFSIWFYSFHRFCRSYSITKPSESQALYLGFSSGCVALFVHSFFVNSLLFPLILMVVLIVAGRNEDN